MKPKYTPAAIDFEADLKECLTVLERGGLVLYPTDTIWGIGCDATNAAAVERVYRLKGRADGKALIVLLGNADNLDHYVVDVPEMAPELLAVAVKPLTIIYDGVRHLAPELVAQDGSAGIRVTREAFSRELCRRLGGAVVSTSANISGEPSPANFSEISDEIRKGVDYIVEYRRDEQTRSVASSIIKLGSGGLVKVIRE